MLLLAIFGIAAAESPPASPAPAPAQSQAKLVVGNRTVFVFRATLTSFTPDDRAEGARRRLDKALSIHPTPQIGIQPVTEGTHVTLDGAPLFLVAPADINPLTGDTTEKIAAESAYLLAKALVEQREQANPRYLLIAVALCAAATLAYALTLRALLMLRRWVDERSVPWISQHVTQFTVKNVRLLDAEHYVSFVRHMLNILIWALRSMATYMWVAYVLGKIPYTRSSGERLQGYLIDAAGGILQGIVNALPGLVLVVVIIATARLVMLTAGSVFKRVESGELQVGWLERDTATPTRRIVNVVIWLFALAMAYPYLPGAQTAAFQGVSVLVGLMISIGASSIVGQGASGLILMYARSLRKGEYVRIGETQGTVIEVSMFDTRLRTTAGEEITMPNTWVLSNITKNYSRAHAGNGLVIDTVVTIGYDTPWRQVHAMLELAAQRTNGVAATPKPYVMQIALSAAVVEYRLVAYVAVDSACRRSEMMNRLHQQIIDVFNEYGVPLTAPHFRVHSAARNAVPKEHWYAAPAAEPEQQ
jgi:small-conductance mechanosensitive channel